MPERSTLFGRGRALVEQRLVDLGYRVTRDLDRRSGRFTVTGKSGRFELYVACANDWGYPMWTERRLQPSSARFVALVRFADDREEVYLIPTLDWLMPELPLVNPQYPGLKSEPEYGIRLSPGNHAALQRYRWDRRARDLPR